MIKISFSSNLKENIYNSMSKKNCCKRSTFFAFLASKGILENDGIKIYANSDIEAEYISKTVLVLFNRELLYKRKVKGRRGYEIFFFSEAATKYVANLSEETLLSICKCDACRTAFLQGLYLAVGRISDPEKTFYAEFSLGDRAKIFSSLFSEIDIAPRYVVRKNEKLIYFKNNNDVCNLLAAIGEGSRAMDVINYGIRNQYKNYANRRANIESSNIMRSVEVGLKQVQIIKKLQDSGKLSLLPDELRKTAILRLEYSDVSLAALGAMLDPPISKSGVNHRLQKIIAWAEALS